MNRAQLLHAAFNRILDLIADRHVAGLENVPPHGPYIVVTNHLSVLDAAVECA